MKLGRFIETKESLSPEDSEGTPSEFPDISIPDTLTSPELTSSNEQLQTTSDLASEQLSLLHASMDVIRDERELSTPATAAISAQLNNTALMFPETGTSKLDAMNKLARGNVPMSVTLEAMLTVMGKLRPLTLRVLGVTLNLDAFLNRGEEVKRISENIRNCKTLLNRAPREGVPKEGQTEYNRFDHTKIYEAIVEALSNGYDLNEITRVISSSQEEASELPETAIVAIAKGVDKLPLLKQRMMANTDIGSLVKFTKLAGEIQDLTIEMLTPAAKLLSDLQTDAALTAAASSLSAMSLNFIEKVRVLGLKQSDDFNDGKTEHNSVVYQVYPDGRSVVIRANGQVAVPQLPVTRDRGYFKPSALQDSIGLCEEKVLPAVQELAQKSATVATLSKQIGLVVQKSLPDELRLSDTIGVTFQDALSKFINAMKISNTMVTIAAEVSLRTCEAITQLTRGTAVLVET